MLRALEVAMDQYWRHDDAPEVTWPPLPSDAWQPTRDTLHLWTQIVGKVRMAHAPLVNHWWNVTLYVTPTGLTTIVDPVRGSAASRSTSTSTRTSSWSRRRTANDGSVVARAEDRR